MKTHNEEKMQDANPETNETDESRPKEETAPSKQYQSKQGMSSMEFFCQVFFTVEGPAIFILPALFKDVGYLIGLLGSVIVGLFYAYIMQVFLWCEKEVQKNKINTKPFSLYSLVESTFEDTKFSRLGYWLKAYLKYEVIVSWSLTLSFNLLYITANIRLIINYYNYFNISDQFILFSLLAPTTFISLVPNLKAISFLAYFVSVAILFVLAEVFYYLFSMPQTQVDVYMVTNVYNLPLFVSTVFFVINFTPMLFPLKNKMKHPETLGKPLGGLNVSIMLITVLNTVFAMFAYAKFGDATNENIMKDLFQTKVIIITMCIFVVTLIAGGALSFYVIFHAIWENELEKMFAESKLKKLYEYILRVLLNLFIVLVPMAIPTFNILINLISCFSFPFDSFLLPALLESVIFYNYRKRDYKLIFIILKNVIIITLSFMFCFLSFKKALQEFSIIMKKDGRIPIDES